MHEALLCRQPQAAVPFVIENAGLRVYSLEELCYYVTSNLSLVDETFCTPELCRWISEEALRPEVGEKLSMMLSEHAALHLIVGTLLASSGYVAQPQLRDVLATIAAYEKQGPGERLKVAADRLLDTGRYEEAVLAYRRMLDQPEKYSIPMPLWADIWNNIGTAYARLFFFSEAADCFAQSYRRTRKDSAARAMIAACILAGDRRLAKTMADKYEVPAALCEETADAMEKLRASGEVQKETAKIEEAAKSPEGLRSLFHQMEKEYRGQTG